MGIGGPCGSPWSAVLSTPLSRAPRLRFLNEAYSKPSANPQLIGSLISASLLCAGERRSVTSLVVSPRCPATQHNRNWQTQSCYRNFRNCFLCMTSYLNPLLNVTKQRVAITFFACVYVCRCDVTRDATAARLNPLPINTS